MSESSASKTKVQYSGWTKTADKNKTQIFPVSTFEIFVERISVGFSRSLSICGIDMLEIEHSTPFSASPAAMWAGQFRMVKPHCPLYPAPLPRGPARAKTPAQSQRLCRCRTAPGQTVGVNCSCLNSKPLAFQETEGPKLAIQGSGTQPWNSGTTSAKIQGHRNLNCTVSF